MTNYSDSSDAPAKFPERKVDVDCYGYTAVPGQPGLCCRIWSVDDERVWLKYRGSREQILSLGIVDASALEPWKRGQPRGKFDLDGDPIFVSRNWVGGEGEQPALRYCLDLIKAPARAEQLPGGALLFENMRAQAREDEAEDLRDLEERRVAQLRNAAADRGGRTTSLESGNVIQFRPRTRIQTGESS